MKTSQARILLFSLIAMLSIFLLGSINRNQMTFHQDENEQLKEIALDFKDIPVSNHAAWENAVTNNPQLLIRLSTTKMTSFKR